MNIGLWTNMRNDKRSKLHILLLAIALLLLAMPVHAENEEPLTLTVEADPDCLLNEAGDMTWFRFTVMNTLEEDYDLEYLMLQGDLIAEPKLIAEYITIHAKDVMEFSLENVRIEEFEFDMDLSFQLAWQTTSYAPDDEYHQNPIVTEHVVAAEPFRIERFVEPVMTLNFSPDVMLAREGDPITITYTLTNETKFDMTNITLQDVGIPQQPTIPMEKNVLNAGETMQVSTTFPMGSSTVELNPTAQYTVRGVESKTSAAETVTVELVEIDLSMQVESYPATSEGTLFRITLLNNGSHPVTDIRITDEIGSPIASGINLEGGSDRTISCNVPSAVSSGSVRYIAFEATGTDCLGGTVTAKSPSAYELLPFVESNQVQLQLTVTLQNSSQNEDGSNKLKLLFEVRNDSEVPIQNAVITEGDYFKGIVNEYATLSAGTTSFEKEFIVPAGTRSLTFVLTAMDPAQTQYASAPITLDLSPLTAPKATNPPAIKPGKTVDTTGTIYDTDRYVKLFRMIALIVLALTLVFLLLSIIFRVAETNIRRWLPKEPMIRPFGPRRTPTGPIPARDTNDPVHDQFGYMQPAKLRYMDRTDRIPAVQEEEETFAPLPITSTLSNSSKSIPVVQTTNATRRKEGDITAVPVRKPRRPVIISSDQTLPFPPVHEIQAEEAEDEIRIFKPKKAESPEPVLAQRTAAPQPREIAAKPKPRIVPQQKLEIVRVTPS